MWKIKKSQRDKNVKQQHVLIDEHWKVEEESKPSPKQPRNPTRIWGKHAPKHAHRQTRTTDRTHFSACYFPWFHTTSVDVWGTSRESVSPQCTQRRASWLAKNAAGDSSHVICQSYLVDRVLQILLQDSLQTRSSRKESQIKQWGQQEKGKRWGVRQVGERVGGKHDSTHLPSIQIIIQQSPEKETPEAERKINVKSAQWPDGASDETRKWAFHMSACPHWRLFKSLRNQVRKMTSDEVRSMEKYLVDRLFTLFVFLGLLLHLLSLLYLIDELEQVPQVQDYRLSLEHNRAVPTQVKLTRLETSI